MPDESPSTRKPDGGPAFPRCYNDQGAEGMSLRAWLLGQALPATRITMPDAQSHEVALNALADADAALAVLESWPNA